MSDRPYVCLHETTRFHWTDFNEIWYLSFFFFRKSVGRIEVSLKSEKNKVYTLRENQYKFLGHNSLISS